MPVPYVKKERQEPSSLTRRANLDLGKKISVPRDLMMEELQLMSNRGSRMFHERLRRVEKFTLENVAPGPLNLLQDHLLSPNVSQPEADQHCVPQVYTTPVGKCSLASTLKRTIAKKGSPGVLAPGYGSPLREVPREKFNITVIPKSYQSPWQAKSADREMLTANHASSLPEAPHQLTAANFRCFNRAPVPFDGTSGTVRNLPLPGFELLQAQTEPRLTWDRMCHRPNFNRAPRGWRAACCVESVDL